MPDLALTPKDSRLVPSRLLFTRREAASMLAISLRKLDQYTASGELAVRRLGGNVLIHFETLAAFAAVDHSLPA